VLENLPTVVICVQAETVVMVAAVAAAVVARLRVMVVPVKAVTVEPVAMPVPVTEAPTYMPVVLATAVRAVTPPAQVAVVVMPVTGAIPVLANVPAGHDKHPELVPEPELAVPAVTYEYCPGEHVVQAPVVAPVVEPEPAGQA